MQLSTQLLTRLHPLLEQLTEKSWKLRYMSADPLSVKQDFGIFLVCVCAREDVSGMKCGDAQFLNAKTRPRTWKIPGLYIPDFTERYVLDEQMNLSQCVK